jgi:hypothetical protein
VVAFYTGDEYAKYLPIRLRCTVPREVLVMKDGKMPDNVRQIVAKKVPAATPA